jgi:quercetin 2,3-dioxygenase
MKILSVFLQMMQFLKFLLAWLYDMKPTDHAVFNLPALPAIDDACLLYIFAGWIEISNGMSLSKGESLWIKNEVINFSIKQSAELILFITNENAVYYDKRMYSGNQRQ